MYILKNDAGLRKEVPRGFSWTLLFFGLFVPLLRGDFKWAAIMLLSALLTLGISWFVFPFVYNRLYLNDLIKSGYTVI